MNTNTNLRIPARFWIAAALGRYFTAEGSQQSARGLAQSKTLTRLIRVYLCPSVVKKS
jgi:hypothetical protein